MPFLEETAEFLKDFFTFLGQFENIGVMFTELWNSIQAIVLGWWDIFSGFFKNLFRF